MKAIETRQDGATQHGRAAGLHPGRARRWARKAIDCLADPIESRGLHPSFAVLSLRLLLEAARGDGVPLGAYAAGTWRVASGAAEPGPFHMGVAGPAGHIPLPGVAHDEATEIAAVLNWCLTDD